MVTFFSIKKQTQPNNDFLFFYCLFSFLFFIWVFNKNKKKKQKQKNLNKIVGLESVKKEINYYIDFIKNKEKYKKWNVKLPKGILLSGPPGTGKTLLVKTIANNLDIPVITASGSEFVEVYVGVGASRIRNLFSKAKKHESCIIFIDELDAIGKHRNRSNNSEYASTLNQLLVEMDGFNEKNNIIVFAATNFVRSLDTALTRSGRFDKKVYFDLPNKIERNKMFKLYLKNIELDDDLSYNILSERTAGLSGADIANIVNQSKINAIQFGNKENVITKKDIDISIDEVMIGREKRERILSKEELKRVSLHEAGHCFMGYILKHTQQPMKVSIVPRGEFALGFNQYKPNNNKIFSENQILSKIGVLLGGRCAEKVIYKNVSTGASDDIEKVSLLVKQYTINWGMNKKMGPLNIETMGQLGYKISSDILTECQNIIQKIEEQVISILNKYKKYINQIGKELVKKETISYADIKKILPNKLENSMIIKLE